MGIYDKFSEGGDWPNIFAKSASAIDIRNGGKSDGFTVNRVLGFGIPIAGTPMLVDVAVRPRYGAKYVAKTWSAVHSWNK